MYQAPNSPVAQSGPTSMQAAGDDTAAQEHFDDFYEEIYEELDKFGKIEEINVCANRESQLAWLTMSAEQRCHEHQDFVESILQNKIGCAYSSKCIWCDDQTNPCWHFDFQAIRTT
jgi:hypothetical protein